MFTGLIAVVVLCLLIVLIILVLCFYIFLLILILMFGSCCLSGYGGVFVVLIADSSLLCGSWCFDCAFVADYGVLVCVVCV